MFSHHKELAYTVRVDKPNPVFGRMLQQAIGGPEGEMRDWLKTSLAQVDAELMVHLAQALPDVDEDELRFRWDCAAGILRSLVAGSARSDTHGRCREDVERMLVPVLAGALAAPRV